MGLVPKTGEGPDCVQSGPSPVLGTSVVGMSFLGDPRSEERGVLL